MPFVKLDTGILDSSVWREPSSTRICWITLLAMADATGMVRSTAPGISARANLGLEETRKALELFESPDGDSRSTNDEGRKIKRMDGGYLIINYSKYREQDRTAAERMRRFRAKVTRNERNSDVTLRKQKQSTEYRVPKHLNDVLVYAKEIGLSELEAQKFYDFFTSNGWKVGGRAAMRDWKAALRNWSRNQNNGSRSVQRPKERAPVYPKLPPKREPTDEELKTAREIARLEASTLRTKLGK